MTSGGNASAPLASFEENANAEDWADFGDETVSFEFCNLPKNNLSECHNLIPKNLGKLSGGLPQRIIRAGPRPIFKNKNENDDNLKIPASSNNNTSSSSSSCRNSSDSNCLETASCGSSFVEHFGEQGSSSLEDLVTGFDETIDKIFKNFDQDVQAIAPPQIRTQEEIMKDCQIWWTLTGNFGNILPIDWTKTHTRDLHIKALNLDSPRPASPFVDESSDEELRLAMDPHNITSHLSDPIQNDGMKSLPSADDVIREIEAMMSENEEDIDGSNDAKTFDEEGFVSMTHSAENELDFNQLQNSKSQSKYTYGANQTSQSDSQNNHYATSSFTASSIADSAIDSMYSTNNDNNAVDSLFLNASMEVNNQNADMGMQYASSRSEPKSALEKSKYLTDSFIAKHCRNPEILVIGTDSFPQVTDPCSTQDNSTCNDLDSPRTTVQTEEDDINLMTPTAKNIPEHVLLNNMEGIPLSEKLSCLSIRELNELHEAIELSIKENSEILIQQLALRDEYEYEKEMKNQFIGLLLTVQKKVRDLTQNSSTTRSISSSVSTFTANGPKSHHRMTSDVIGMDGTISVNSDDFAENMFSSSISTQSNPSTSTTQSTTHTGGAFGAFRRLRAHMSNSTSSLSSLASSAAAGSGWSAIGSRFGTPSMGSSKSGSMSPGVSIKHNNVAAAKNNGNGVKFGTHLTTVIPYHQNCGSPDINQLQIWTRLLKAMNDDSPMVPAMLTDYILKVVLPNTPA